MTLAPQLKDALADLFTLAANGEDVMECYVRSLALLEAAPVTLDHPTP